MLPSLARCSASRSFQKSFFNPSFRPTFASSSRLTRPSSSSSIRQLSTTRSILNTNANIPSSPSRITQKDAHAPHPSVTSEIIHPQSPLSEPAPKSILDNLPRWASPAKPYLALTRIDKPIGTLLLFWPCTWSITMASTLLHLPITTPLFYISLFGLGALIMRGAGCTINDMWDAKMDAKVDRTKSRPLASGDVTQFQALSFLGLQLSAGLAVLTQLNWYSIVLGASSLSLVVLYPFMKRITYYPQVVFGMTFNWGVFLGWSAVAGVTDWTITAPMYLGGIAWGIAYDLIYAHQDKLDDVKAGVKSMALRFPDNSRTVISVLYTTFVSMLTLTGHLAGMGPLYYMISCGATAAHLAWQTITVNFDDRADCWRKFCSNGYITGGLVWLGIAAEYVQNVSSI
ncbi:4-hydroxybenzoate polyprenyl transferase [Kwoniella mangroviensis CBS 8886]|uniref:4-hydroxybenzoate polyprenyl transferase n=1 Tax=Kwoniella mangroviensis CBS 8507 TaxID=1296122 RepID=UPI00080CE161|nr:4-hydroxybenzoate polyprenyl transferase [Kwoniella mangroviensis CBS 8507]OCF68134.1 4-hydroxybenzoate polyprenyl transferase [Kwoniella mangroviensis CBS 8507]OCF78092.1 4-hydroxybenzoate polyprenyl transferase [Kwoniella mangroviensis CBS 8886]